VSEHYKQNRKYIILEDDAGFQSWHDVQQQTAGNRVQSLGRWLVVSIQHILAHDLHQHFIVHYFQFLLDWPIFQGSA